MKTDFINTLSPIIKKAGEIMLSAEGVKDFKEKHGEVNYVTIYDEKVQAFLIENIKKIYPNATFIAEEKDNDDSALNSELCFIIDPIDGTTNFIRNYKTSSISVGIWSFGEPIYGAVLNPYLNELYTAEKGKGAFLNDQKITVSDKAPNQAVFAFGSSPYYKQELGEKTFDVAKKLFFACADIRRTGSAALDFCHLASGRIDLFFECRLSPWDFAAGSIIVKEAGGIISDLDGNELDFTRPCSILCGNPKTYQKALEIIKN